MRYVFLLVTLLNLTFCEVYSYINEEDEAVKASCPAGYTGAQCDSPICDKPSDIITHDGTTGDGDLIAWDYSFDCNEEFQFYVDEFITNITLTVLGGTGFMGAVYKNDGLVKPQVESEFGSTHIARFYDIGAIYGYGQYRTVVQSDGLTGCEVYVSAPTTLTVDGGFVTDPRDDNVQSVVPGDHQGVSQNPKQNVSSYFAFQVSSALKRPGHATQVTAYLVQGTGTSQSVKDRYNCATGDFAGPFTCEINAAASYHIKINGVDTKGNMWQRIYKYNCDSNTTPAPTTPLPPPNECFNGGILHNVTVTEEGTPTTTQECYCGNFYEGRRCETMRCFNGGYTGFMGYCVCQTGYSGDYCQNVYCDNKVGDSYDLSYKAVIFVIRTGKSMIGHIDQIIDAASKIENYYSMAHSTYIAQWILVTVTNGNVGMYVTQQSTDFISAIKGINNTEDTICDDTLLAGISTYLDSSIPGNYQRSPIYVFADGIPNDGFDARMRLLNQLSFYRGQIFFLLADSATGRCNIDTASEGYRTMRYIAQFTQGHVSHVPLSELGLAAFYFAVSSYSSNIVMANDLLDSCQRAPKYQSFFIDESIPYFFISTTGKGINARITRPDRTILDADVFYNSTSGGDTMIWSITASVQTGGYLLELQSSTKEPCSVRVYGPSSTDLWVGISKGPNDDASIAQPTYNEQSHIVSFINNVQFPDFQSIHAEATIWTNAGQSDKRTVLYGSGGTFRNFCDFHLYFGSWKCVDPYEFFYMNFFVTSIAGSVIQRSYTGFCSVSPPTQKPPGDCLNGGQPLSNGTCLCPAHFVGDKCQTIQCLNLGTSIETSCLCINGFTGQFCETPTCYQRNRDVSFSPDGRSLTLIIQDSISSRTTIKSIIQRAPSLIQDLSHQQLNWITNYQLWRFNDTTFTNVMSSSNPNDLMQGLNNLNASNTAASDPSCRDLNVLPGLLQVLFSTGLTYNGVVYLFINGYMKLNSTSMDQVDAAYELLEKTKVQLHIVLTSSSPCGTELNSLQTLVLMNLASFSGGEFYNVMPSRGGDIIRSVPTQYRNSYLYENWMPDCTTPKSFYFPVDSQLQSFTAYIIGDFDLNSPPTYFQPDGKKKVPYTIWDDAGMGTRFDQIIKECDDGWTLFENRCWKTVTDFMSWNDARALCHQNNAVLPTILNAQDQSFISYFAGNLTCWIGLHDQISYGEWIWDTLYGQPLSLDNTGYKNWAAGQPILDENRRCVSSTKYTGWTAENCEAEYPFFCVKHAYDADYEPAVTSLQDLLARGIWKITLQTVEGPCYVQIYGQSGIQYYGQFSTDIHSDSGSQQPLAEAADNRIIAHVTNQQKTGTSVGGVLEYSHFYRWNMSIIQAQTFQYRNPNDCAFEYLSATFKCPATTFLSLNTGVDRFGYLYQRIQPIACYKGPTESTCINGTYYGGHCYCDPYYEDDFCSTPVCQQGTLDSVRQHCTCYSGYIGTVCNTPVCNRYSGQPALEPTPTNRTFILLLDGSQAGNMGLINSELDLTLTLLYDMLSKYPTWFTHYTGLIFRDQNVTDVPQFSESIESDNFTDFKTKIIAEASKTYVPAYNTRSIMAAVVKVMESAYIQPRSFVWVITNAIPEDANRVTAAMYAAGRQHCYVNFLIVGDTTAPGGVQYNDTSLVAIFDLITSTGGQYYQVSDETGKLAEFWTGLFSNYYNAYSISTIQKQDCTSGFTEYIQMGSNTSTLIIDAVGMGQINIYDPDGFNNVTVYTAAQSKTNTLQVANGFGSKPGLWKIQVPSYQGYCKLAIRGQSTLDVYIAFTHDVGADGGLHSNQAELFPVAGDGENAVVAYSNFGKLNFAQVFSPDERTLIWSSPLISRRQCVYNYVSSYTFTCTMPSFAVAIDGQDDNGFPFRRMIHVHCVGRISTTMAPPTLSTIQQQTTTPYATLPTVECNATAPYDVVLMFDGSGGISEFEYKTILSSFAVMTEKVLISQNYTRFMLGSYTDTPYMSTTDFTIINNSSDYLRYLKIVEDYFYTEEMANNIQSIFDMIDPNWWRTDAERVIVFFSSLDWHISQTGIPYKDPTESANAFVRSGGKLVPIGYGQNVSYDQLAGMGQKCTQMAVNLDQMETVIIPWVTSAICNPDPHCGS